MKIKILQILSASLFLLFACGPSDEEKQNAMDKNAIEEGRIRRAKEDSLQIVNQPKHIALESAELLKRGVKTINVCRAINEQCSLWAPNYSGTGWHETNIRYDNSMEKNRRFLHIIENTSEWKNRDSINYYLVAFFRDLEQKSAPPDLNIGFARKTDVIIVHH